MRRQKNFPFFLSFYIPNTKELVSALDHHLMCRRRLCLLAATQQLISPILPLFFLPFIIFFVTIKKYSPVF
jgi:hypothetical protein